ncbi:MAG: LysM peptidoglycan-binding domain-containing protein, partial [Treponema sp.]|nr:LysM peptidoglycan-binding domain-containing protein [Treponema sp.]
GESYTVKPGDSYWKIAYEFYGSARQWQVVYEANRNKMKNPDNPHMIFPGMELEILSIADSFPFSPPSTK